MNSIPCKDCICIPICRHKTWDWLRADCSLMHQYVRTYCWDHYSKSYYLRVIDKTLKPTKWFVIEDSHSLYVGRKRKND